MTPTIRPAPVRRSVTVAAGPEKAFEIFTQRMGMWWPAAYHIGAAPYRSAVVEPRQGGRWYEVGEDGSECEWGHVIAWERPSRLVLAWQIDGRFQFDPDLVTEVEIRFEPVGEGSTRVDLEHRNLERMGEAEAPVRATFEGPQGWQGVLALFAEAVGSK